MQTFKYVALLLLVFAGNVFADVSETLPDGRVCQSTATPATAVCSTDVYDQSVCKQSAGCEIVLVTGGAACTSGSSYRRSYYRKNCVCPSPMVFQNGVCVNSSSSSSSSKSSISSTGSCTLPKIIVPLTGLCELPVVCTYPTLRVSLDNTCIANPDNCPPNTKPVPKLDANSPAACIAFQGDHTCPPGWHDESGFCALDNPSSSTASGVSSSAASSVTSSQPQTSSSGSASSASNSVGASTSSGSNNSSGATSSVGPNNSAITNCQLTFGVDRCTVVSTANGCPNSYVINGTKFCISPGANSGSASSSGGSGAGNSGQGSSVGKGECDPTAKSYDECMGRNEVPDGSKTVSIKSDFDSVATDALDDYMNAVNQDIQKAKTDGIPFENAANNFKAAIASHMPQFQACTPVVINFPKYPITLQCEMFEVWKVLFAWFLSISTCLYIFELAMRPVER